MLEHFSASFIFYHSLLTFNIFPTAVTALPDFTFCTNHMGGDIGGV
jgi:hypothetical protein